MGGRTSGTRPKGSGKPASGIPASGPGWGGRAKGFEHNDAAKAPTFGPGNQAAAGYHDMSKSQRLAALDELKFNIAMGLETADMVRVKALESYEDRHLGKSPSSLQVTGDAEHPVAVVYSWADAPDPE